MGALTDAEIRQLATNTVEPNFPTGRHAAPAGAEVTVQISVDETGKLTGIGNTRNVPNALFLAAYAAMTPMAFSAVYERPETAIRSRRRHLPRAYQSYEARSVGR